MHTGECPKCEKGMPHVKMQAVELKLSGSRRAFRGLSYQCPHCDAILSVGYDPLAIQADTISEIVKRLGAR